MGLSCFIKMNVTYVTYLFIITLSIKATYNHFCKDNRADQDILTILKGFQCSCNRGYFFNESCLICYKQSSNHSLQQSY